MLKRELKQQLLDKLYEPYKNCLLCPLSSLGRTQVVFGRGNPDAKLMFIGEAPGKDEDTKGLPFVGRSGKLLSSILASLSIDESEVYITNIVKCRPPGNRAPSTKESRICIDALLESQLSIINPSIICTLGSSATKILLQTSADISKLRGAPQAYKTITVVPAYHPAYVLRKPKELNFLIQDIKLAKTMAEI